MKCYKCGAEVDTEYCGNCGTWLSSSAEEIQPTTVYFEECSKSEKVDYFPDDGEYVHSKVSKWVTISLITMGVLLLCCCTSVFGICYYIRTQTVNYVEDITSALQGDFTDVSETQIAIAEGISSLAGIYNDYNTLVDSGELDEYAEELDILLDVVDIVSEYDYENLSEEDSVSLTQDLIDYAFASMDLDTGDLAYDEQFNVALGVAIDVMCLTELEMDEMYDVMYSEEYYNLSEEEVTVIIEQMQNSEDDELIAKAEEFIEYLDSITESAGIPSDVLD